MNSIKCYTTRPDTFLGFLLALSIDHPVSKLYENNKDFIKFKMNVQKLANIRVPIAQAEK